jgi:lysosomal acid lipase/cholesteryl ester hydrolase
MFHSSSSGGGETKTSNPHMLDNEESLQHILKARCCPELCTIFGHTSVEHSISAKDGFLLSVFRLEAKACTTAPAGVVLIYGGFGMGPEIWVCSTDPSRSLPFVLASNGYDVWVGSNRGYGSPERQHGWDFDLNTLASDLEEVIQSVLAETGVSMLSYVGFSQGTTQAFIALTRYPELNSKVDLFVALAPVTISPSLVLSLLANTP